MLTAVSAMTASTVRRVVGLPEIEDRPVACGFRMVLESPGFQPHPERNEQETEHEQSGDGDEDDQARVRVLEESSERRQ